MLTMRVKSEAMHYAIKYIKIHSQWSSLDLATWITRPTVSWLHLFNFSNAKDLSLPEMSGTYTKTVQALEALQTKESIEKLRAVLNQVQSDDDRAAFATALLHWNSREKGENKDLIAHIQTVNALLEARLGTALYDGENARNWLANHISTVYC